MSNNNVEFSKLIVTHEKCSLSSKPCYLSSVGYILYLATDAPLSSSFVVV